MSAPKVSFNTTNLTTPEISNLGGVNFVMGKSIRGGINSPDKIFNSWPAWAKEFGGLMVDSDAPRLCKKILQQGGAVRFCRVAHYTDITDAETLTATKAVQPNTTILIIGDDLITGNTVNLTVESTALTAIPYNTSNDQTISDIISALEDQASIKSVKYSNSGSTQYLTIEPVGTDAVTIDSSTITGGDSQATIGDVDASKITDGTGNPLFSLSPKYAGEDYNNLRVTITSGSNGQAGYFDLTIQHMVDRNIIENYRNLYIPGQPNKNESNYLLRVIEASQLVDVVYEDLSYLSGQISPVAINFNFVSGNDGEEIVDADYVGSELSNTGFRAFDNYDDAMQIAVLDNESDTVHIAGSNYAALRQDLNYFIHLGNHLNTREALVNKRNSLGINNKLVLFSAGGLKLRDELTSTILESSGVADLCILANKTSEEYGPWYSFAGNNRGIVQDAIGVINNFGTPAKHQELDALADAHINMFIQRDNVVKLWGSLSGQYEEDQERFINVVRLVIYIKKQLKPIIEDFIEEPNVISSWKRLFFTVKPFMDDLVEKRALYSYEWLGDQDAKDMNNLAVNDPVEVSQGKYKIRLRLSAIPGIRDIEVDMILTDAGVTFETIQDLI